jgi:hypothetical protein
MKQSLMADSGIFMKAHKSSRFAIFKALVIIGASVSVSGCDGPKVSWSAETRSPDGKMVAHARTIEPSGIGTGDFGTFVDLNWTAGSQPSTVVLAFADGSDEPSNKNVGITWLTPTHLELTYTGHRTLDFQAVKCHGVDISVRNLSTETLDTPVNP